MYAAAISVHVCLDTCKGDLLPKLDSKGKLDESDRDLPPDLLLRVETLTQRLVELSDAIRDVMSDDFTHYNFGESTEDLISELDHIYESSLINQEEKKLAPSVRKLSDIKAFIDIAIGKLRVEEKIKQELIGGASVIDLIEGDRFEVKFSNANVRTFVFIGLLIHPLKLLDARPGSMCVAQVGAAIIHDLIKAVPDGGKIAKSMAERYEDIDEESVNKITDFDPSNIISPTLAKAIEDAGDIYLLEEKKVAQIG